MLRIFADPRSPSGDFLVKTPPFTRRRGRRRLSSDGSVSDWTRYFWVKYFLIFLIRAYCLSYVGSCPLPLPAGPVQNIWGFEYNIISTLAFPKIIFWGFSMQGTDHGRQNVVMTPPLSAPTTGRPLVAPPVNT